MALTIAPDWKPRHLSLNPEQPHVRALLAGYTVPWWLEQTAGAMAAAPSPLDRAASVGLVARLWSPTSEERDRVQQGHDPNKMALAWFNGLDAETQRDLGNNALSRCIDWREGLDALPGMDSDDRRTQAIDLITEREVLESVAFLLGPQHGALLRSELCRMDAAAEDNLAFFPILRGGEAFDAWMSAAAALDPLAWWPRFGA